MLDLYTTANASSDMRAMGLMTRAGIGVPLVEQMRSIMNAGEPQKRRIPSAALLGKRDLTSTTGSAGGYLVGTTRGPFDAIMRGYSVLGESGLRRVEGLQGAVVLPTLKTKVAGAWLAADGSTITEGAPAFGHVAMDPKYWAVTVDISRQLMLQSDAEDVAGEIINEAAARAIDAAILGGSGAAGQPTGIVNTTGVHSQAGAGLNAAGLAAMRKAVLTAGAREDRLRWIGAPDVQEVLGARDFSTGAGRPLWDNGRILGLPAVATAQAPAGTLILGDWGRGTLAFFDGAGIGLEFNPYADFRTGLVSFRLILPLDVGFSPAAAFSVATNVN